MHTEQIRIETGSREQVHDLTKDCQAFLHRATAGDGLLHVSVPHATAGLAVIETGSGSDTDLLAALRELLPADDRWRHRHGYPGHGRDHLLPALLPPATRASRRWSGISRWALGSRSAWWTPTTTTRSALSG